MQGCVVFVILTSRQIHGKFGLVKKDGKGNNLCKPEAGVCNLCDYCISADSRKFGFEKMRITMGKDTTFANWRRKVH